MKTHKLLNLSSTNDILFVGTSQDCLTIKQQLIDSNQLKEILIGLEYLTADELVNFNKNDMNLPKGIPIEDMSYAFLYPESQPIYDPQTAEQITATGRKILDTLLLERKNYKEGKSISELTSNTDAFMKFYQQNSFRKPSNS